ncbi:DinB family protein [Jannaschia rubra]|uniref:DinB family protein n=1 Tax=Jannaschia rubra TaxID=282197 RepID=A0A0M6XQK7_9RHOB|nr:DinB family protein [Jannaschia rubra]CTQ32962.1 DinB family protein [Jannaschia rubra]SFG60056.1 Uncharacterized damage-inducible protein DinB (forms a four-helix bundle) [Jannaschia rubra]
MITLGWVRMTALYNAWQNSGLRRDVQALDAGEATRDRGAFFGSILGTCDHLLRADKMWLSRIADGPEAPPGGIAESRNLTPDVAAWAARRKATDTAITRWAEALSDCDGDLTCSSGALGRDIARPMAVLLTHFFNRQTHHRGQIHAMLTAAGVEPEDTDLPFMPEPA